MCIFWLRGQDLLKTLPLKCGFEFMYGQDLLRPIQ
jgi:hypothetical protein